jgi:hypothetical protein
MSIRDLETTRITSMTIYLDLFKVNRDSVPPLPKRPRLLSSKNLLRDRQKVHVRSGVFGTDGRLNAIGIMKWLYT